MTEALLDIIRRNRGNHYLEGPIVTVVRQRVNLERYLAHVPFIQSRQLTAHLNTLLIRAIRIPMIMTLNMSQQLNSSASEPHRSQQKQSDTRMRSGAAVDRGTPSDSVGWASLVGPQHWEYVVVYT